ncbi:DUF5615 family PIN-like protein [Rhodoplanes sp. TEM]|uniref:DUF5615 family PIN-like protein n=2 Tax=Rhodoplanes TaxID=29407 RepID=A0ABT5JAF3_RHOTP|nr:DUF5615 family PIN-like protein [Rhodoplanes tepidamans]MDC7786548.1 DUF5615 family PIN-like protein [Rhodoplanes tepidamans]MDC7983114.1 DUF5615 family PIN-like protein [Rhodoplanes sp. TEM]MDQ0357572.1 putative nuclease of putative toxin-antitoxin system [Rhodoplanes tepidamans]
MNLSPAWTRFLQKAGYPAQHWSEIGPGKAPDEEVLQWAADHDHVLLTSDLDFGAVLAGSGRRRPSVVQVRSDLLTPGAIGAMILAALRKAEPDLVRGALPSIDPARARMRVLPLPGP